MSSKLPGLREAPYIGSWSLGKAPSAFSAKWETARQDQRLSDGTMNRATQIPFTSACIAPTKGTFTLTFDNVNEADKEILTRVASYADGFDFCPWVYLCESFVGATSGVLARRNGIDVIAGGELPTNAATKYAHWSYEAGAAGNVTVGAIDTTNYRQAWAAGNATLTEVLYYPVFRVYLTDWTPVMKLSTVESWQLTLRER